MLIIAKVLILLETVEKFAEWGETWTLNKEG